MVPYRKLVRDKIPQILGARGIPYTQHRASPKEFERELIKKILEEAVEFAESNGDPTELADLIEVLEALKVLPRYKDVEAIRLQKYFERGGFEKQIIVEGEK